MLLLATCALALDLIFSLGYPFFHQSQRVSANWKHSIKRIRSTHEISKLKKSCRVSSPNFFRQIVWAWYAYKSEISEIYLLNCLGKIVIAKQFFIEHQQRPQSIKKSRPWFAPQTKELVAGDGTSRFLKEYHEQLKQNFCKDFTCSFKLCFKHRILC